VSLPYLADILRTLDLAAAGDDTFVADQIDNADHHIIGGHIAAQALMAASRTAAGRLPHSAHVYLLRTGDARYPVEMRVSRLRDGGALSTRQITAHQGGEILLEALASSSVPVDSVEYQQSLPAVPDPETLPAVEDQLRPYADESGCVRNGSTAGTSTPRRDWRWICRHLRNVPEYGGAQRNR
jgi:acyl-CoA thioesterase II